MSDEDILGALKTHNGSRSKAADAVGLKGSAFRERLRNLRASGVEVPPAAVVHGTSTLRDGAGNLLLQWTKANHANRGPDQWAEAVREAFIGVDRPKRIPVPSESAKDLLAVYPIGDHHTAMYAWGAEAGADYDLRIAENLLVSAIEHLVDITPPAETALIVNVGDFFHVDQHRPETTRSHNALDVDTRYAQMIHTGVAMLRACIEAALSRHRRVRVVNACGNHDDVGSLWLSLALGLLYEKNPRVEIDASPAKFTYYQHGKVLLGVTHGDTVKLERLAGIMATDQAALWGQTEHRHWLTGHIHHRKVLEQPGCMVESFRTLAARDAWATAAGYRAGRDMTAIVFHREHGEVARHRFDVGMVQT